MLKQQVMNSSPKVTVIVLTYNHEKYINQCLESIISQKTTFPIEVIVGEDCSTDKTGEVVNKFQYRNSDKVRVVTEGQNVGLMNNCRRCEEAANGEYIAYCGGDDYWCDPYKLEQQVELLSQDRDIGIVHTDYAVLSNSGCLRPSGNSKSKMPNGYIYSEVLQNYLILPTTACIRADALWRFHKSSFYLREYAGESYIRWAFISKFAKVQYIDGITAVYRKVLGSITNRGHESRLRLVLDRRKMLREVMDELGCEIETRISVEQIQSGDVIESAIRAGNRLAYLHELESAPSNIYALSGNWVQKLKVRLMDLRMHNLLKSYYWVKTRFGRS